jgi:hypothetical protein
MAVNALWLYRIDIDILTKQKLRPTSYVGVVVAQTKLSTTGFENLAAESYVF